VPQIDVIVANGVIGEMARVCLLYCARLFQDMFAEAECPLIIFNNFGNPLETSPEGVVAEFNARGFQEVLNSQFYAFSSKPDLAKRKLASLESGTPLFRPSGRVGERAAADFVRASWDEVPGSLAFNCYVTGWTPPIFDRA
jgi:hypothetical protein